MKKSLHVKESNAIARAKIDPGVESIWDERIIALVASQNAAEDKIFQEHVVPITELTGGKPLSTMQYKEAQKAIKERIIRQTYVIRIGKKGFKAFPIFEYIEIDDEGNIKAKLNSALHKHFFELKKEFALRSLPEFSALTSTYSQQIFRWANSLKGLGKATITVMALHDLLGTPPSFRKTFQALRERVLEIAIREINDPEKTNSFLAYRMIKKGLQKIEAIEFIFDPALLDNQETEEEKIRRELAEVQRMAEDCWQMYAELNKKCRPGKRSKKCHFCTASGRMWAQNYIQQNQQMLPGFDEDQK